MLRHHQTLLALPACLVGARYAADKLTELVTAALDDGTDPATLASLQVNPEQCQANERR